MTRGDRMFVRFLELISHLTDYAFDHVPEMDCRIEAVCLHDPAQELKSGCLYLLDAAGITGTLSLTSEKETCFLSYGQLPQLPEGFIYGSVRFGAGFAAFVNAVNQAFTALAASPDRITERISVLARCENIQQLVDAGSELLGSAILLADMNFSLVAASTMVPENHSIWSSILRMGELPVNLITSAPWLYAWETSIVTGLPCTAVDPYRKEHVALYAIRGVEGQHGILLAADAGSIQSKFHQEVLVILGRLVAGEMKLREEAHMSRCSAVDSFLCFLLQGNTYPDITLAQRAAAVSLVPGAYMRVYVFHSADFEDPGSYVGYKEIIRDLPKSSEDRALFFEGDIVLIQCSGQNIPAKSPAVLRVMKYAIEKQLMIGISREFQSLQKLRQSYLQARDALDLGAIIDTGKQMFWYEEYADFRLLQLCARTFDLQEFCHPGIFQLYELDRKTGSRNIETLKVYLENQRSISRTAQILHIHRNTVTYRVEQSLSLCGTDLGNRRNMLHILLSLHIIDFLSINPENLFRVEGVNRDGTDLHRK